MINALEYQFKNTLRNYGYDVIVNVLDQVRILLKEYEEGTSSSDYKYMLFKNGLIKQGDIVKIFDDNWLVLHEDITINDVYTKVIIRRLKFNISFNFEGDINAIPSAIDTGTMNVQGGNLITIQDGRIVLHMQENETTKRIALNQRFLIMGSAWKVIQKTNAEHGIYKVYADIVAIDSNVDDMENEIADRWTYETKPKNIKTVESIADMVVEYGTLIDAIALPSVLIATLDDGTTTSLDVVWNTSTYNPEIAGTYALTGTLTLTEGVSNTNNLNAKVNIIVEEEAEIIALAITGVDRISVYDDPQSFTVNTTEPVTWSISGGYAKIQSTNGNSCVVTYVDSMQFGTDTLRVELVADSSVFAEKTIEIVFM